MMNWWRNAVIVLRLWLSQCCLFEWICIDKMMVTGVHRSKTENYNAKMLFHKQKDSVGHWQRQWILINKRTSGIKVYEKCSFIIMIRSKQYLRLNEAPMKNKLNTRILKQQQKKKTLFVFLYLRLRSNRIPQHSQLLPFSLVFIYKRTASGSIARFNTNL